MGVYKKNPSIPDLHINCNLTSDNMPKIHPETKVLIIKRLKTRSTAEVADTFNVSQCQVQRIRKRYEETGDVFDKPRSGRPRKTTAREDRLLAWKSKASPFSTAAELHETWSPEVPVWTRTVCRILSRNGLHGQISAQKPALNKRQFFGFCQDPQPAKSMDAGKSGRRWISQRNLLLNYITVTANIAGDLLEPAWIWDSPKKQSSLVAEKSWVTSSMGVCEICKVEGNINSLKYQEVLVASYILQP